MAYAGLILSILGAAFEMASGPGSRLGLWSAEAGLAVLKAGFALSAGGFLICQVLVTHQWRKGQTVGRPALVGWVLSFVFLMLPLAIQRRALSVPIHNDYTTDPQDPPQFTVAPKPGPASVWPGLEGKVLEAPEEEAFERAQQVAGSMDWEIVKADPKAGIIEAVAVTPWFGLKEDVVIRVRPEKGMSRVDLRSASRSRGSDLGNNARRIEAYLKRIGK